MDLIDRKILQAEAQARNAEACKLRFETLANEPGTTPKAALYLGRLAATYGLEATQAENTLAAFRQLKVAWESEHKG